ncbi:hypothetical protein [Azohydromonas caseinilytica]|uniref:Uncharacterized protein n=1 Tax=Azohydromonas caseinilytica TaxID=2728836 RepID=A0A848FF96_9BURK|nr:hypothetical protein [Azohydromonas caseinilytica]NML16933.1 hypothetical protein [Azohydromonas caseinilytica]
MKSITRTVALAVLIVAPVLAAAQGSATPAAPQSVYRSAFEGYRPFADEPVRSWRETNDTVGRIGGWKTYAREAQSGDARAAAAGASAPAAAATGGAHSNHHAPAKP